MGQIGNFGSLITFETRDTRILTFSGFKHEVSAGTSQHTRFGQKPAVEFTGPQLGTVSFEIILNASHGVKPRATLTALEEAVESGYTGILVIGGKQVGTGEWMITNLSESWDYLYDGGELVSAKANITLQEYF